MASTTVKLSLSPDTYGTIRIGRTRVTLDTVVESFKSGETAEDIAFQYPTLELGEVYAAISYYLQNQSSVEEYLQLQASAARRLRDEIENQFPPTLNRQMLVNRRSSLANKSV